MGIVGEGTAADSIQVALKKFVDDVGVLAIENCLVKRLPLLFTPDMVFRLEEEDIALLAAENEQTSAARTECTNKLTILEGSLSDLRRHIKHCPAASAENFEACTIPLDLES